MCANLLLKSQLIYFSKQTTPVKNCFFTVINQQLVPCDRFVLIFSNKWQTSFPHVQSPVANLINWKHMTSLSLTVHTFLSGIYQCFLYHFPAYFPPPPHIIHQEPSLHVVFLWPAVTESYYLCSTQGQIEMTICPDPETRIMTHHCTFNFQCLMSSRKVFSACVSP